MFDFWGFGRITQPLFWARFREPLHRASPEGRLLSAVFQSRFGGLPRPAVQTGGKHGTDPKPLYQVVAEKASAWDRHRNIGLVVGATQPQELEEIRSLHPAMPILIPGVGAQGGDLESAVRGGVDERGRGAIINSSRGVIYARPPRARISPEQRGRCLGTAGPSIAPGTAARDGPKNSSGG